MTRRKRTAYQRIMRAAERGTGCRLSADDCIAMSLDTAVAHRAELDEADECEDAWHETPWYARGGKHARRNCPTCHAVDERG